MLDERASGAPDQAPYDNRDDGCGRYGHNWHKPPTGSAWCVGCGRVTRWPRLRALLTRDVTDA